MFAILQTSTLPGGYGLALLQALVALLATVFLAWLVLRWLAARGLGVGRAGGRFEVLERLPLDARRSLVLVRLGDRILVVGVGDGAAPSLVCELPEADLPAVGTPMRSPRFAELLRGRIPSGSKSAERPQGGDSIPRKAE